MKILKIFEKLEIAEKFKKINFSKKLAKKFLKIIENAILKFLKENWRKF